MGTFEISITTKQLFCILTFFISTFAFGQSRTTHIKTYVNGDTSLWYKWKINLCNKINLDTIQNSENNWHFRLWTDNQAIDILKNSSKQTYGKVTSWTNEYTPDKEEPTNRIFFEKKELDSIQVSLILSLIDSTQINTIPDEYLINGWSQGFDGITYIIEVSNQSDYYFKTYWTPIVQDSLKEAIIVQYFVDNVLKITSAKEIWRDFASRIPFESYTNNGSTITIRAWSQKERRRLKKERKRYRQQKL